MKGLFPSPLIVRSDLNGRGNGDFKRGQIVENAAPSILPQYLRETVLRKPPVGENLGPELILLQRLQIPPAQANEPPLLADHLSALNCDWLVLKNPAFSPD
jgi:hypothetical protein